MATGPDPGPVRYRADAVVPCDGTGAVFLPGEVEVTGDVITAVGPVDGSPGGLFDKTSPAGPPERGRGAPPPRTVRVRGALLPGMVNVHCHSPMSLFRGSGENLPLDRWLREVVWPQEAHLTEEDVYWGMALAAAELAGFGVTTSCEAYFHPDAVVDAVVDAGSRAVVTPGVLQLPGDADGPAWWQASIDAISGLHARRHGEAGRIEIGFAPHAPYTVPLEGLVDVAETCRQLGGLFHIHLAETEDEVLRFQAEHGRSAPAVLAAAGVFDGRVLAAHGVWLSDEDIGILRAHDVAVAHCPQSNAKLAAGMAPLVALLDAGIRVGLGTDGPASNNDLDLWEEVRLAAMLARLRERDPAALSAEAALSLATREAGRALGRSDLGVLAVGAKADLLAVDLDVPAFVPLLEEAQLVEHLVWSASSRLVTDVWVAGGKVVEDGRSLTVDVDRAMAEVAARARRLRLSA